MVRVKATDKGGEARDRVRGRQRRAVTVPAAVEASEGLYAGCLEEEDREALARARDGGLEQEMAVVRVLIRRAIVEGRPAREVAQLLTCLSQLLKTHHVISGHNAKQLDDALAAALDAIGAEM